MYGLQVALKGDTKGIRAKGSRKAHAPQKCPNPTILKQQHALQIYISYILQMGQVV